MAHDLAEAIVNKNVEASQGNISKVSRALASPVGQLSLLSHTGWSVVVAGAFSERHIHYQHLLSTRKARDAVVGGKGSVTSVAKLIEFYGVSFYRGTKDLWKELDD